MGRMHQNYLGIRISQLILRQSNSSSFFACFNSISHIVVACFNISEYWIVKDSGFASPSCNRTSIDAFRVDSHCMGIYARTISLSIVFYKHTQEEIQILNWPRRKSARSWIAISIAFPSERFRVRFPTTHILVMYSTKSKVGAAVRAPSELDKTRQDNLPGWDHNYHVSTKKRTEIRYVGLSERNTMALEAKLARHTSPRAAHAVIARKLL